MLRRNVSGSHGRTVSSVCITLHPDTIMVRIVYIPNTKCKYLVSFVYIQANIAQFRLLLLLIIIIMCACLCECSHAYAQHMGVSTWVCTHQGTYWGPKETLGVGSFLSPWFLGSNFRSSSLCSKSLYLLSHLAGSTVCSLDDHLTTTEMQLQCSCVYIFFLLQGGKLARFPHVYWPSVFHLLRTLLISWEGSLVALFDFFFDLFRSMYIVDIICNIIRYYS